MYIKVTIIQIIHSLNKDLLNVQLRFTHSPHPLLPQQQSVCNLSFPPNQLVFRFHRWNFSTRMFVFPQLQAPRWWIHSLAPKSTSPGSFPRLGPSQSLSRDQEELCRLSVPWKWWCRYILPLKPQEIMNAKKICKYILRPTSVLFYSPVYQVKKFMVFTWRRQNLN